MSSSTKMLVLLLCALACLSGQTSCASVSLSSSGVGASEDSGPPSPHPSTKNPVRIAERPLHLLGSSAVEHSYPTKSASKEIAPASNLTPLHNRRVARAKDNEASLSNKTAGAVSYDVRKRQNFGLNSTRNAGKSRKEIFERHATFSPNLRFRRDEQALRKKAATNSATPAPKQKQETPQYSPLRVGAQKINDRNVGLESKTVGESSPSAAHYKKEATAEGKNPGVRPKGKVTAVGATNEKW